MFLILCFQRLVLAPAALALTMSFRNSFSTGRRRGRELGEGTAVSLACCCLAVFSSLIQISLGPQNTIISCARRAHLHPLLRWVGTHSLCGIGSQGSARLDHSARPWLRQDLGPVPVFVPTPPPCQSGSRLFCAPYHRSQTQGLHLSSWSSFASTQTSQSSRWLHMAWQI